MVRDREDLSKNVESQSVQTFMHMGELACMRESCVATHRRGKNQERTTILRLQTPLDDNPDNLIL